MSERLITVLSPFYNSEEFIQNPINCMYSQTYKNWEWVCVDDCSTDNTYEILKEYAAKDSRIKVYKTPYNLSDSTEVDALL